MARCFRPIFVLHKRKRQPTRYYNLRMDFGKLPDIEKVIFSLPADPPQNVALLAALPKPTQPRLYIGPTGYNMKPWVGKWYPHGAKDKDHLRYYGAQFNTIEHNTTHYRIPDFATVVRWRDETPDDFRFCPKIPQSISHAQDLALSNKENELFCEAMTAFGVKLGGCFMQLPPGFSPRNLMVLKRYLEQFPEEIPLAVEARHPAFFQSGGDRDRFFHLLQEYKAHAVITDVAGRRDVCHMQLSTRKVLIRFVGNGLHPSDFTRVSDWSRRLKGWFEAGLESAYFFTHEPDNLLAPELAAHCFGVFQQDMPGVEMRGPKQVAGQQGSLF